MQSTKELLKKIIITAKTYIFSFIYFVLNVNINADYKSKVQVIKLTTY